jgi:mannosyltransferase
MSEAQTARQRIAARDKLAARTRRLTGGVASYLSLAFVVVLAAATRFLLLGHQSLYYREIVSLILAKQPFGAMLDDIARTESTPPLYYVLLWVWVRLFGTTADALRSLSACFGVLTVVALYFAARARLSRGAALVVAALAATNPMLIWYSQETRAYAVVTFFLASSLYFMLRARDGGGGALAGWSAAACLALASHYFAVFALVPEAAYLLYLYRHWLRPALFALVAPLAVGAALLPLAIHQRNSGHAAYIAATPLASQIKHTIDTYLLGPYQLSALHLLALCLLIAAGLILSIGRWASPTVKRNAVLFASLALTTFILPLIAVPGSFDARNMIVALPPCLRRAAAAALLVPTVLAAPRVDLQREDWRGMATLIGPPSTTRRAVLTYPAFEYIALTHYRPDLKPVTSGKLHVREIVLVGLGLPKLRTLRLPAGFQRVQDKFLGRIRIIRLRSRTTRTLNVGALHLRPFLRLLHQYHSLAHTLGQDATLLIDRQP